MKNQMRQKIVKVLTTVALCAGALGVSAAEQTQVAYGIKWTYLVSNGKAIITSNTKWVKHPESPVAIKIPAKLGGCPVEKIKERALSELKHANVQQLIIPEGVTAIYGDLMGLDSSMKTYEDSYNDHMFNWVRNESKITNITLPKTLKSIGPGAFAGVFKGKSIILPEGLECIGERAFYACKMSSIKIPESVKEIGAKAFSRTSIKSANIPSQITVIPFGLFMYTDLESVSLHDGVTKIEGCAFNNSELKSIKLPRNLTTIEDGAFGSVKPLEKIEIPNGVTSIGKEAFNRCVSLEIVTIPNSVKTIGAGAFTWCKNLTSVTIPARFKSEIPKIFGKGADDRMFEALSGSNLNDSVPPSDVFNFTGPSTASSKGSVGDNKGQVSEGDDFVGMAKFWMEKIWNEHTEAVCWGGAIIIVLMLIGSIKNAKKKAKKE